MNVVAALKPCTQPKGHCNLSNQMYTSGRRAERVEIEDEVMPLHCKTMAASINLETFFLSGLRDKHLRFKSRI